MKLNLGCGSQVIEGWINVDYALGAKLAKVPFFRSINRSVGLFNVDWDQRIYLHDLTKALPWPDASADVVYSSHTLEHLARENGYRLLAECRRVLRKNGLIRIVVPDLRQHVREYIEGRIKADTFLESLGVLYETTSESPLKNRLSPFLQFPHKCMYDTPRLLEILGELGFDAVPRSAFESEIADIRDVELPARTEGAVIVEGRKR